LRWAACDCEDEFRAGHGADSFDEIAQGLSEARDERAKEDKQGAKEGAEEEQGASFDGKLRDAMAMGESGFA
jgi:hypothetical protein